MAETENRVAIVTGAAGGLGSAVARLLASSGHDLALVDNRADEVERFAEAFYRNRRDYGRFWNSNGIWQSIHFTSC